MKKLFSLLCVIALLGALLVPAMAATAKVPVVAEVPADWTAAYLYAWGGSEEMAWPGVPMTKIDDWFVAYMNDDNMNVIINNGTGIQTADLAVDPGMPVCVMAGDISKASVEFELPIEVPEEDAMPKPAADTVYALAPEGWATAYLYAWGDTGSNAGWPGVEMTKGDDGLYVAELTPGYANVIIAEKDGGAQTVDLPYNGGEAWVLLTAEAGDDGKFQANIHYEKPETIEHPTEITPAAPGGAVPTSDAWYVAGTMNEWNCCDEAYKMTDNGDGTFSYTFTVTAGNHALKVTNGTWDVSFGGNGADGNYEFSAAADCEATVTYDGNGVVTVTGSDIGESQGTAAPAPSGSNWYVAGTMNEWNCCDESYKMTANGDGTFSYSYSATAGDHSLKVTNGTWDVSFGGDGENGNYDFNVPADGNVTVTFDGNGAVAVQVGGEAPEATEPAATEGNDAPEATEPVEGGEDKTDFIRCVAFGKGGEFAEKSLHKGMRMLVSGAIQTDNYTDKDGKKVSTWEVVVASQDFADSKGNNTGSAPAPAQPQKAPENWMSIPTDADDEGLPFN